VAEWFKALVSKTSGVKALAGSNPVVSASFVIREGLLINIFNKPLTKEKSMTRNHDEEAGHDHTHGEEEHSHEHEVHGEEGVSSESYLLDENANGEPMPISSDHGHGGHSHETSGNVLVDAWEIFSDPGHFIAEIGFSLIIDFFIIFLGYQLFIKKVIIPRLRKQIHKELDQELNIDHQVGDDHPKA
jgi:hypothetical protein